MFWVDILTPVALVNLSSKQPLVLCIGPSADPLNLTKKDSSSFKSSPAHNVCSKSQYFKHSSWDLLVKIRSADLPPLRPGCLHVSFIIQNEGSMISSGAMLGFQPSGSNWIWSTLFPGTGSHFLHRNRKSWLEKFIRSSSEQATLSNAAPQPWH